jgi:heme-degrading monooxygenase HmoA
MILVQELLRVPNNRQSELVERQRWIHGLMQPNPGFVKAQVARFLGNATDYLILRYWNSREEFEAFRQTPDGQNYPKSKPEGLFESLPVGRLWENAIDSPGTGAGNFLVRSLYHANDGRYDEFVENRRRHDGLALQVPGTVGMWMWRCIDDSEHKDSFQNLAFRVDRDAYNAYLESPQAKEYRAGNVRGLYKTQGTECYEVVAETTA